MKQVKRIFFLLSLIALLGILPLESQAAIPLYVGQSTILSAPDPPSGAALNQTAWGCSNPNVSVEKYMTYGAKVTINSYFTGTAEIRCDYYYFWYDNYGYMHTNNATTYFQITCNPVTLSISPTSMNLYPEEGQTITYSYSPSNVSPKPTIRFLSSNTNVATVSSSGYVRAVGSGKATITVENSAGPNATCSVYVKEVDPTGIDLSSNLSLEVDESKILSPTIYPSYAKRNLTWSSADESIATVSSSGSVYGKKKGTVKITVTTHNGYSDYCTVTVKDHKLTLSANPKGGLVDDGTQITLTADKSTASIYYTLNGNTPSQSSTKYNSPIVLHQDVTLKAIAIEDRFVSSDVLTETYKIASLDIVDYCPQKDAEDVSPYAIPYIKFNQQVKESANFGSIQLLKNGTDNVSAEFFTEGEKLWIVPNSYFEIGASYKTVVPENAVMSVTEVPCKAFDYTFSVYPYAKVISLSILSGAIVKSDGSLWMWGINNNGLFGNGTTSDSPIPIKVMDNVQDVSLGWLHTVVLKKDGTVWTSGRNDVGELGIGTSTGTTKVFPSFTKVISDVISIAAKNSQSFVIKSNGTMWAWGNNYYGQLGNGSITSQSSPVKVLENVISIAAGDNHTAAIKNDGSLYLWGSNHLGEVGGNSYGGDSRQATPRKISVGLSNFTPNSAALGNSYTVVLSNNGQVAVCGCDSHGENGGFGNGTTFRKHIENIKKISAGLSHIAAIKKDGSLYMWGNNDEGQLGDYTKTKRKTPVFVTDNVVDVSAGYRSTGIIKSDGSVWTWGSANNYVLGDGSSSSRSYPVKIMNGKIELENLTNAFIPTEVSLVSGTRSVLPLSLSPTNGKIDSQHWSSSDENVVSVNNRGVITALSPGIATVTVNVNGSLTSSCLVTVDNPSSINVVNNTKVQLNLNNSSLEISGATANDLISVHRLSGLCIYSGYSKGQKLTIPLKRKGVYIVKIGTYTSKIVYQ